MKAIAFVLLLSAIGCVNSNLKHSRIARLISPDLINQHIANGTEIASRPAIERNGDTLRFRFCHCTIEVAKSGCFLQRDAVEKDLQSHERMLRQLFEDTKKQKGNLTEEKLQALQFFSTFFAHDYPDIGSQAIASQGWDGESIVFTTSDGRYDVRVERIDWMPVVSVEEVASDLSDKYDQAIGYPWKSGRTRK